MASAPPNAGAHSYHPEPEWGQGPVGRWSDYICPVGLTDPGEPSNDEAVTATDARSRGLTLTERLELHHLPDDGLLFEETLDPAWVDGQLGLDSGPTPFVCQEGPTARMEVQPMGAMATQPPILIRGRATARFRSTCVRCLAEVLLPVAVQFEQMLFSERTVARDADGTPVFAELDEGVYADDGVDLPNVLREGLLLEIAMNPTCEDETGCDARTRALIDDVNAKNRPAGDPRWAPLAALKKPS